MTSQLAAQLSAQLSRRRRAADAPRGREWCRVALGAADIAAHHAVRRAVFVTEQRLFTGSDEDARDLDPRTVQVVGLVAAEVVGAVRLYPLDDGALWKGDRLAVLPDHRAGRLGAALVRFAVATAACRGGARMVATVQQPNETFFRRLGWSRRGEPADYLGVPHVSMDIPLTPP